VNRTFDSLGDRKLSLIAKVYDVEASGLIGNFPSVKSISDLLPQSRKTFV
jgi:hypothetical protein